jgi:flagellar basal-body rod protein FlgF
MPMRGIVNTAHTLSYYRRLQEVTANNLANANTDAFKVDRMTARQLPGMEFPVSVERTDLEQGRLRETGRPLDLSLEGPGFFVVNTPRGERLTRGGSLRLDASGLLIDGRGDPLVGADGPLRVNGSEVEFTADGTVLVDGAAAGRLRIETVDDPASLLKEGSGRYIFEGTLRPVPENQALVRQGSVEEANLDPLLSMVELMTIQRSYAANADALKALDSVLGAITNEVGKVSP